MHIPIGYDSVSETADLELLKLVRDAEGPFYIHCHHGRHRGPTAAAIVGLASDQIDRVQAIALLESAGTSRRFGGLWDSVQSYKKPPADAVLPELVDIAEIDFLVTAMAQIDRDFESLSRHRPADWVLAEEGSSRDSTELADLIREGFRESLRHLPSTSDPTLRKWLAEAEQTSRQIVEQLRAGNHAQVEKGLQSLKLCCNRRHSRFRD